jgi:hypothetical protein
MIKMSKYIEVSFLDFVDASRKTSAIIKYPAKAPGSQKNPEFLFPVKLWIPILMRFADETPTSSIIGENIL